jgi:Ca2+-binding RTX toxin-like protein
MANYVINATAGGVPDWQGVMSFNFPSSVAPNRIVVPNLDGSWTILTSSLDDLHVVFPSVISGTVTGMLYVPAGWNGVDTPYAEIANIGIPLYDLVQALLNGVGHVFEFVFAGNDVITSSDTDVGTLWGAAGADEIHAGPGGGVVFGAQGDDQLHGDSGADSFYYESSTLGTAGSTNHDTIHGFQQGQDQIYLDRLPGIDNFQSLVDAGAIDTVSVPGSTVIHIDPNNSITLAGITAVTATDFQITPPPPPPPVTVIYQGQLPGYAAVFDVFDAHGTVGDFTDSEFHVLNTDGTETVFYGSNFTYGTDGFGHPYPTGGDIAAIQQQLDPDGPSGEPPAILTSIYNLNWTGGLAELYNAADPVALLQTQVFSGDNYIYNFDPDQTQIAAGNGADQIYGSNHAETIDGGAGADLLVGNGGNDDLTGGTGADRFHYDNQSGSPFVADIGGDDTIHDFAIGEDTIELSFLPGIYGFADLAIDYGASPGNAVITIGSGPNQHTITLIGIDGTNFALSAGDFAITNNPPLNLVYGTPLDDPDLQGTAAADEIFGLAGDDDLFGLAGNDLIHGGDNGARGDILRYDQDSLNGGANAVTVDFQNGLALDGFGWTDNFDGIEGARGTSNGDQFYGGSGYNFFQGLDGGDFFFGNNGDFDEVDYSEDANYGGASGVIVNLSQQGYDFGFVFLNPGQALDGFGQVDTLEGIEIVTGTQFSDFLIGGDAGETLRGGGGADTLVGGGGSDDLTGGDGLDHFYYAGNPLNGFEFAGGFDIIRDFTIGEDNVVLDHVAGINSFADLDILYSGGNAQITLLTAGGPQVITLEAIDGTNYVLSESDFTIYGTAPNNDPVNTVPGALSTPVDNARLITGVSVSDVDGDTLSVTLQVSNGVLGVSFFGAAYVGGTGTSTLTFQGSATDINDSLATLAYQPAPGFEGSDALTVTTSDGRGGVDIDPVEITVGNGNHAPVNFLSGPLNATEDTPLAINGLSVSDADGDPLSVTLHVGSGRLSATAAIGASLSGSGTASLSISGSAESINATLATLGYLGNLNFHGPDSLSVQTIDSHGASATDSFAITVAAANDEPVNFLPGNWFPTDSTPLPMTGIVVTDVDGDELSVTLAVQHGMLSATAVSGANVSNSGSASLTVVGTIAAINSTLSSLSYLATGYHGPDSLTVTTSDGHGGSDSDQRNFTVASINHAPTVSGPSGTANGVEDTPTAVPGFTVADVDGDALTVYVSASFCVPALVAAGSAVVSIVHATGLSITGSTADINATLASLTYQGLPNYFGADTLYVEAIDSQGSYAFGSIPINVAPVNDAPTIGVTASPDLANGSRVQIDNGVISGVDIEDGVGLTYHVSNVTGGYLGTPGGVPITSFTAAQLASALYFYDDGVVGNAAGFDVTTTDSQGASSPAAHVTVNMAPAYAGDGQVTVTNGGSAVITGADLHAIDADTVPADLTYFIIGQTHGQLLVDGNAAASFTEAQLLAGLVSFGHDDSGSDGSFTVVLADQTQGAGPRTIQVAVTVPNNPPLLGAAIVDQVASEGAAFSFTVPGTTFIDPDHDLLALTATLASGAPLPGWLSFNPLTGVLSGTPGYSDAGSLDIRVTATDPFGHAVDDVFALAVDDVTPPGGGSGPGLTINDSNAGHVLIGSEGEDVINGNGGSDQIFGLAGHDVLNGGAGHDLLYGGTGADDMAGGLGNDTYYVESIGDQVIEAYRQGTDTVHTTLASYQLGANVEYLVYDGNGIFAGTGNELSNRITGGDGGDRLDGQGGADDLRGGLGDDTYVVDQYRDVVREAANSGTDTVEVVGGGSYSLSANVENLVHVAENDFTGYGNGLANRMTGNDASERLYGGNGDDTLLGGGGNDTLHGGYGTDRLEGGTGDDTLIGGAGLDTFIFAAGFGHDTIRDFDWNPTGGQDHIDVTAFGISALDFASRVLVEDVGRDLMVTIDGNTDQTMRLSGIADAARITADDFYLAASV